MCENMSSIEDTLEGVESEQSESALSAKFHANLNVRENHNW